MVFDSAHALPHGGCDGGRAGRGSRGGCRRPSSALPLPDPTRHALGLQLEDLSQRLEERIALYEPTDESVATVEHLISILEGAVRTAR